MRPVGFSDEFTEFGVRRRRSHVASHGHFQEAQMARNNHQEASERASESARAGVREATDRAENVMQTGIQAAQRVAEEFGRVFGVGGQNENLTRQATQNFEAITETGSILIRGFQDVSREWLGLTEERVRKNSGGGNTA